VSDERADAVLAELRGAAVPADLLDADTDPRVTVVPASSAKGLEFDTVVLLEPAEIVEREPTRTSGLRRLYVVLTRAVSRLVVLHDRPLPQELAA
jgi:superfamily I DNA/RNA helicase